MSVTRIIHYDVTGTGHAAIVDQTQTVNYVRKDSQGNAGYKDAVTGAITYVPWTIEDGSVAQFPAKDVDQITGFDSYVDGTKSTKAPAADINTKKVGGYDTPQNGATVNVTYKKAPVTPTTEHFSQDIKYQLADGTVVKTATGVITATLTDGTGTIAEATVNNAIDSNMPEGYDYVSGRLASDETVNSSTGAIVVTVKKSSTIPVTPTTENYSQDIVYQDKDGNVIATNKGALTGTFTTTTPATVSAAEQKTAIDAHVPANWKIASSYKYPEAETISKTNPSAIVVTVEHGTQTVKPTDPGVTPDKPEYKDMFKTVTRTINVTDQNKDLSVHKQAVDFSRSETIDLVTNEVASYGAWTPADGTWDEFDAPQIDGYTSYVDGIVAKKVAAETVTADTADVTVNVIYLANSTQPSQPSQPSEPTQPSQPSQPSEPTQPSQPSQPSQPAQPSQPTTPGDNGNTNNPGDNNQPVDHNGNGLNSQPGQPEAANGNGINGYPGGNGTGNGASGLNGNGINGNGTNSNGANANNNKSRLPQTGNAHSEATVAGLGIASLAAMLGLAGATKRKHE